MPSKEDLIWSWALREEVYIEIPLRFEIHNSTNNVWLLKLYGLEQSSRLWFGIFMKATPRNEHLEHEIIYLWIIQ